VTTVAVFGGSFNPPHVAHVLACAAVLSTEEVDKVLVVPTFQHPLAKSLAPYGHRVRMSELAMAWLPKVEVSRVEEELGGESRTLWTLEHLQKKNPDWRLRFVIGADILLEAHKWFRFDRIREIAPLVVLGRCGVKADEAPVPILPDVSSTEVRAKIAEGKLDELAMVVPRAVLAYVKEHALYRAQG
jgi:nicotinate-nucleotide adenylyltransferase